MSNITVGLRQRRGQWDKDKCQRRDPDWYQIGFFRSKTSIIESVNGNSLSCVTVKWLKTLEADMKRVLRASNMPKTWNF